MAGYRSLRLRCYRSERSIPACSPRGSRFRGTRGIRRGTHKTVETTRTFAEDAGPSDERLLDRVCQRDSAALRLLFQRYYTRVFAFSRRRLRDPQLAEEVTADVFFEVWRSANAFEGASRPATWIFGIARFKCSAAHRDRSRLKRSSVVPANVEVLHGYADQADFGVRMEARDELRQVQQALEWLPEEQRRVMELAVIEGLPYEEISQRLRIPEGTVKTRVARARARLRGGVRSLSNGGEA